MLTIKESFTEDDLTLFLLADVLAGSVKNSTSLFN